MNRKILFASLCLLLGPSAQAQDATLTAVQGSVRVRRLHKRDYTRVKEGDKLAFGEWIATGPKSKAHLEFKDNGSVLIQENSIAKLEGNADHVRVNFDFGEFLIGLKKKSGKKQSFQAITPAAVAAVRGTLFWGKTDLDKTATFASFGGTIQITAQGKTVAVAPGQSVSIHAGEAPPEPKPSEMPSTYLNNFAIKGGIEGLDSLLDAALREPKTK